MIGLAHMAWRLAWTRSIFAREPNQFPGPLPRFYTETSDREAPSAHYYRIIDAISRGEQP